MDRPQRGIQSIEVGGRLLAALADEAQPLALGDLARRAGMTPAKAHPYLVSFGKLGLVEQDGRSGRYGLGPFALQVGLASLRGLEPLQVAMPECGTLAAETQQTVALAVAGSHGPTIVHLHESTRPVHVNMRTGTVMSIVNTATGRVFAAFLPEASVERLIAREKADASVVTAPRGDRVPRSKLDAMIAEVRRHRLSRTVNRPIPGISALSAPVFDHAGALALAVTVLGPTGTFDTALQGPTARRLGDCARRISRRLGYRPVDT